MTIFFIFLLSSWFSGLVLQNKPVWMRYLFLACAAASLCYIYLYTSKI